MWNVCFNQLVQPHGGNLILECDLNKKDIKTICKINTFMYEVLTSWMTIQKLENTNSRRKTIVWNNSYIRLNNTVVFYTFDNFQIIYCIPATECLVYSCFIKSIPISIENRCVLDNAINDNTIQILQIALKINKVIKYFNSLQKSKTKNKTKQEVKWDTIIEMYSKKQAYIFPLVQHQTQF